VLLSAAERRPREIAKGLCCAVQTVRNGIRAFNASGLAALSAGSSRPKSAGAALDGAALEQLRAILHASPRAFGHARSTWTLGLLARVAHEQGLSAVVLSVETIRQALLRLGVCWRRAKRWRPVPTPPMLGKNRRDRLIDMVQRRPGWTLGFADEVWFSRLVQPSLN
jgi:transposase